MTERDGNGGPASIERGAYEAILAAEELLAADAWGRIHLDQIWRAAGVARSTGFEQFKAPHATLPGASTQRTKVRAALAGALVERWRTLLADVLAASPLQRPQDVTALVLQVRALANDHIGSLGMAWGMAAWSGLDPLARDLAEPRWERRLAGLSSSNLTDALVAPVLVEALLRHLGFELPELDASRFVSRFLHGWVQDVPPLAPVAGPEQESAGEPDAVRLMVAVGRWGTPTPHGHLDLHLPARKAGVSRATLQNQLGRVPLVVLNLVGELLLSFESALSSAAVAPLETLVALVARGVSDFAAVWPIVLVTDHAPEAARRLHEGAPVLADGLLDVCPPVVPEDERALFLMTLLAPVLVPLVPAPPPSAPPPPAPPLTRTTRVLLGARRTSREIPAAEREVQPGPTQTAAEDVLPGEADR